MLILYMRRFDFLSESLEAVFILLVVPLARRSPWIGFRRDDQSILVVGALTRQIDILARLIVNVSFSNGEFTKRPKRGGSLFRATTYDRKTAMSEKGSRSRHHREPIATYTKIFTCNPLGENDYYDGGEELVVVDLGEVKICPLICYDVRFPELWRPAAISGVDVFTVSSSWPKQRISHWHSLLIARALENQAFVVAANRVGEDAIATWGGNSLICTPLGELLAQGTNTEIETCSATIDSQLARSWRKEFPVFEDIQEELIGKIQVREITA